MGSQACKSGAQAMRQCRHLVRRPLAGWRPWLRGLLASVVLTTAPGAAVDAPAPEGGNASGMMTFHDETLAVRATAVPLTQVMAELSRLSGARVRWLTPQREGLISVDFPALPLAEALERLVGDKHFLLFYAPRGPGMRLSQIWITARPIDQEPSPSALAATSTQRPPLPLPGGQPAAAAQGDPHSGQSRLAAQGSRTRLGTGTQPQSGRQEDTQMDLLPSSEADSARTPSGQEGTAALGLLGGSPSSAAGLPTRC